MREDYDMDWVDGRWRWRAYPAADPAIFIESSTHFGNLYADAEKITKKISSSPEFSGGLMKHAQKNEKDKAIDMIRRIGLSSNVDMRYTPDTLSIILNAPHECCQLIIRLRWG